MQTIQTKFLGATNTRGARIKATTSEGKSAFVDYSHELSGEAVHFEAVKKLCKKLNWKGDFIAGATKSGYVFVFTNSTKFTTKNEA